MSGVFFNRQTSTKGHHELLTKRLPFTSSDGKVLERSKPNTTMTTEQLKTVAEVAADGLKAMIVESSGEILDALAEAEKDAALNEKKPNFKIGLTISLQGSEQHNKLSYGIRRSLECSHEIEDPRQGKLPEVGILDQPTVEIRMASGKTTGPVPLKAMANAVKIVKERADKLQS